MIVPDASIVLSVLFKETASEAAERLFRENSVFIAPELLLVECGNAIRSRVKRGLLEREKAVAAMDFVVRLPINIRSIDLLMQRVVSLSLELDNAAYDCVYLALALSISGQVATADITFAQKVERAGYGATLITLSH